MTFHVPEKDRIKSGIVGLHKSLGNNGVFFIQSPKHIEIVFKVIASDGFGWEHVSISLPRRTPIWQEMCFIKGIFWDDEDTVIQFHPPKSEYVNCHPFCLHLWRRIGEKISTPDSILVGIK